MTLSDLATFKNLAERVTALEAELIETKARVAELEAKRGPGRPTKEAKAA